MPVSTPKTTQSQVITSVKDLTKVYYQGKEQVIALNNFSLSLKQGEFLAIMGPSGSGKSTLLYCWATLDRPTSGIVEMGGNNITGLSDKKLTELRREQIGFVFQSYNLIPTLSAKDNILLPFLAKGKKLTSEQQQWYKTLIDVLGISNRIKHLPHQMSGGQQQRVAIARALVTKPSIVFADEPSGNLDTKTGNQLLEFLSEVNQRYQQSIVIVTHSATVASYASKVIFLKDGAFFKELVNPSVRTITAQLNDLEK